MLFEGREGLHNRHIAENIICLELVFPVHYLDYRASTPIDCATVSQSSWDSNSKIWRLIAPTKDINWNGKIKLTKRLKSRSRFAFLDRLRSQRLNNKWNTYEHKFFIDFLRVVIGLNTSHKFLRITWTPIESHLRILLQQRGNNVCLWNQSCELTTTRENWRKATGNLQYDVGLEGELSKIF